jgi:hypothetical protein
MQGQGGQRSFGAPRGPTPPGQGQGQMQRGPPGYSPRPPQYPEEEGGGGLLGKLKVNVFINKHVYRNIYMCIYTYTYICIQA